ncbi:MAG: membrane dipeptidase [Gemmatimonadota bacterium]|nr:membrane dipeptidase [Gemmatimonadota bacterium]
MDRRTFVRRSAGSALALGLAPREAVGAIASRNPDALIMDAMGELRRIYEPPLVRRMLASGMDSITITLCDPKPVGAEALELAIDELLAYDRYLADHPDLFVRAASVADVDEARRTGRLAVFYLYQNTIQFGEDLDRIDMFYRLGLRSCQLTYNERNHVGVGCRALTSSGAIDTGGLTRFGRETIDRMNDIGMLVDVSHANERTMADAIAHSSAPIHNSHTGCADLYPHIRNMSDANMLAMAERGGVIGICQLRPFLTSDKPGTLDDYLKHVDHAVQVAGIEHVCIGSDRDHRVIEMSEDYIAELRAEEGSQVENSELPYFIPELNGPSRMTAVWDGLVARGYSEDAVERIMGTNLYRLYAEVIG